MPDLAVGKGDAGERNIGLGGARKAKEATLAVTRLRNDLRPANG